MRIGKHLRAVLTVLDEQPCNMKQLKALLPEESRPSAGVYAARAVGRGFVRTVTPSGSKRYVYYITQAGSDALQSPLVVEKPRKVTPIPSMSSVWQLGIDKKG